MYIWEKHILGTQIFEFEKNSFSKKVDFVVHLEIDQNGKLVSLKSTFFLAFLNKIWDPENFTFASENGKKSEALEKV